MTSSSSSSRITYGKIPSIETETAEHMSAILFVALCDLARTKGEAMSIVRDVANVWISGKLDNETKDIILMTVRRMSDSLIAGVAQ